MLSGGGFPRRSAARPRRQCAAATAAACADEADPQRPRNRERAADRCGPDRPLHDTYGEVARPELARLRRETGELVLAETDANRAVEDADRRGHGPRVANLPLAL